MQEVKIRGKTYSAATDENGQTVLRRFNEDTGYWVKIIFSEQTSEEVAEVLQTLSEQYAKRMAG